MKPIPFFAGNEKNFPNLLKTLEDTERNELAVSNHYKFKLALVQSKINLFQNYLMQLRSIEEASARHGDTAKFDLLDDILATFSTTF